MKAVAKICCLLLTASAIRMLPDERIAIPTEKEIAELEAARAEAAKVKKNPQQNLIDQIRSDMDQINQDLSFGVSFSQNQRNKNASNLCTKIANSIIDYTNKLIKAVDTQPDEAITEQIAHNIGVLIFYDVQLE